MASSFTTNFAIEKPGTGEQSGTWGDTTNTNLELIGQATAWGTRAIANASTDNITIADGAADADRCLGLKLTGGGQACTVTLLPNTSSKTWFMYNATSYTLTFTCGSGANVAILAGETKVGATAYVWPRALDHLVEVGTAWHYDTWHSAKCSAFVKEVVIPCSQSFAAEEAELEAESKRQ